MGHLPRGGEGKVAYLKGGAGYLPNGVFTLLDIETDPIGLGKGREGGWVKWFRLGGRGGKVVHGPSWINNARRLKRHYLPSHYVRGR